MLRLILRSSSSISSTRVLPSATSTLLHSQIPSPAIDHPPVENRIIYHVHTAFFHSQPSKLDFINTNPSNANTAAENSWFDVEKSPRQSKGGDEGLDIDKLGIADEIVSTLAGRGIVRLFPIQRAVLEPAMAGRDMYGRARTGTGKTLAFGIPILDKIIAYNKKHGRGKYPLALVLAPTRELARQVEKEFHDTAPSLDMICVYGGTPIARQMRELDYGVDVVVGTPGRIIDLMKRGSLNLEEVQFVVIDEADQMLSVGFVDDVETIFQRLPNKRHSMLFSATMPSWIRNLIRKYLKDPLTIDLVGEEDQKLADGISLFSIESEMYGKASVLVPLITEHAKGGKCIVFTQTKRDADRLAEALARKLKCEALHGDISQAVRERTLAGFRNGYFNVLVATDVAARGLDIPNVDLVVHYEIPNCSETFVHRSGRTGRAGKKGTAILIYTEDQSRQKKIFEREIGCKFTELPRIEGDASDMSFSTRMRSEGRYGGFGGPRDRGSRFSGSNRFDDFGRSSGGRDSGDALPRFGNNNRRENAGDRRRDSDFGGFGDFGSRRPGKFGDDFRRSGGFANSETRSSNRRF